MARLTDPEDAIGLCVDGSISPEVALCRLLLGGADAAAIRAMLRARPCEPLQRLLEARETQIDGLAAQVRRTSGNHAAMVDAEKPDFSRVAAFFDGAVAHSPEASVALYSLGDPEILAAATAEIVDWLSDQDLLGPDHDVLDLGCGVGRVASALAPRCRSVLGLDVSAGMVLEARRRCGGLAGVRFEVTSGRDLEALASGSLDLILAVDSFPYVIQGGASVIDAHLAGAARALRDGGALAVLNWSYGREPEAAELEGLCARHGLALAAGGRPFRIWDARAFVLRPGA
jgi:SAM-dependent methyltransferase